MSYTRHQVWSSLGRNSICLVSGNRAGFVSKKVGFPLSKPQYEGDNGELCPVTWHTPLRERVSIGIYMCAGEGNGNSL